MSTITCAHCGREIQAGYLCDTCSDAEWDSYWDSIDHDLDYQRELSEEEEWRASDNHDRAADMNATLNGGW